MDPKKFHKMLQTAEKKKNFWKLWVKSFQNLQCMYITMSFIFLKFIHPYLHCIFLVIYTYF